MRKIVMSLLLVFAAISIADVCADTIFINNTYINNTNNTYRTGEIPYYPNTPGFPFYNPYQPYYYYGWYSTYYNPFYWLLYDEPVVRTSSYNSFRSYNRIVYPSSSDDGYGVSSPKVVKINEAGSKITYEEEPLTSNDINEAQSHVSNGISEVPEENEEESHTVNSYPKEELPNQEPSSIGTDSEVNTEDGENSALNEAQSHANNGISEVPEEEENENNYGNNYGDSSNIVDSDNYDSNIDDTGDSYGDNYGSSGGDSYGSSDSYDDYE